MKILLTIKLFFIYVTLISQINQLDSLGRKQGLWIYQPDSIYCPLRDEKTINSFGDLFRKRILKIKKGESYESRFEYHYRKDSNDKFTLKANFYNDTILYGEYKVYLNDTFPYYTTFMNEGKFHGLMMIYFISGSKSGCTSKINEIRNYYRGKLSGSRIKYLIKECDYVNVINFTDYCDIDNKNECDDEILGLLSYPYSYSDISPYGKSFNPSLYSYYVSFNYLEDKLNGYKIVNDNGEVIRSVYYNNGLINDGFQITEYNREFVKVNKFKNQQSVGYRRYVCYFKNGKIRYQYVFEQKPAGVFKTRVGLLDPYRKYLKKSDNPYFLFQNKKKRFLTKKQETIILSEERIKLFREKEKQKRKSHIEYKKEYK